MSTVTFRRMLFSPLVFWLIVCAGALYMIMPLRKTLRLGIDLVGGTFITLEVQTDKAVEAELANEMQSIDAVLKKAHRKLPVKKVIEGNNIVLTFNSIQEAQDASRSIQDASPTLVQKVSESTINITFPDARIAEIKQDAVVRNIQVMKTRLDRFSVAEIPIARQGERNIVIELPDINPQEAKDMIGRTAQLEFRLVDRIASSEDDILYELDGEIPDDKEILPYVSDGDKREYCLVQKYAPVSGRHLRDAKPTLGGQQGVQPVVSFTFTKEGGDKFYELTSKNLGKPLAVVLDREIISIATIQAAIRESGVISGDFTTDKARSLAHLLKSGAFVAPVTFEQERQIGPALGAEAIKKGLYSCLIGLILLFIFSIFYYKVAGIFAFSALIFNLILILVGMAWLQATLTLPGIAGMILTVGMAIDASILIFEHVKEELARGLTLRKAIDDGFSGAMAVILDANITTFLVGIVLYHFGTGPIQGFAVTMMLGIIATLITGLFFLRSIFSFVFNVFGMQTLKI